VAGLERGVRPIGALVDVDDLVEGLDPFDLVVRARLDPRPLQAVGERFVDDLVHER